MLEEKLKMFMVVADAEGGIEGAEHPVEKARAVLEKRGYTISECVACTDGTGHLYVLDPVHCQSGSKKWRESKPVRISTYLDALTFIEERS